MNKFYLVFSLVGTFTHALWGFIVTRVNDNLITDSFEHRAIVVSPFIILSLYSYFSKKINIEYVAYAGIFFITADYCYLIAVNNNNLVYSTGLYVVLTASLAAITKRWFLWLYAICFFMYCSFSIIELSPTTLQKTHWGNMYTLIGLMTFFGVWRIKKLEQLESEYRLNIEKSKKLEDLNNIAAQAAHDIRSPVMALESFASANLGLDPSKLKIVSDAAKRVNRIADNLVEEYRNKFSNQIDSGTTKNIFQDQTVAELIQSLKDEKLLLQSDFRRFKLIIHGTINYKINDHKFQFELKRVLSNIINNSIESFDDSNGTIDLMLSENGQSFCIQVKDNGTGIPRDILEKVFERGVTYNKAKGTGLGLSHAREVIERFNGKIDISSKYGLGTLVQINITKS